jgi:hypothetical protein
MRRNARMKRDVFLADIGTRALIMGILKGTLVGSLTTSLSAITAILRVHDVEERARRAAGPSGDARHVACSSAKHRKPTVFTCGNQ